MAGYHVTLKATLSRGTFYWVTDLDAENEAEALADAEALFMAEMDSASKWAFEEGQAELL